MAATANKRRLPDKVAAMKARKRQKLDDKSATIQKASGRKVRQKAESLDWKSFQIPDHLEDYEGLYGLQEVEDVDVVKDPETGQISFMAIQNAAHNSKRSREQSDDGFDGDGAADGEEWSGFDEVMSASARSVSPEKPAQNEIVQLNDKKPMSLKGTEAGSKHRSQSTPKSTGTFESPLDVDEDATVDTSAWNELGLMPDTLAALSTLAFSKPTPIQEAAILEILAGHDVIGKASTGSGKTLAFGIPILETYLEGQRAKSRSSSNKKSPVALVLSPTRDLAHQLEKHLTQLCSNASLDPPKIANVMGGLAEQKQQRQLRNADIVIGTPGRLWQVISQTQDVMDALKGIQYLVVDEADRLLKDGHFKEVEDILNALDRQPERNDENDEPMHLEGESTHAGTPPNKNFSRQTLVFSATFDRSLQRNLAARKFKPDSSPTDKKDTLAWLISKLNFREERPKFIDVNPDKQMATGLKEGLIECAGSEKDLYLYALLLHNTNMRTLVFANSINAVRRLTPFLQNLNFPAIALHSGMPQKTRMRSIERFMENSGSILVATDVAARGLDIPEVQLVIHYHLPRAADMYVHRSGRTARAGQTGSSILICAPEEVAGVRRLVAKVHASSVNAGENGIGGRKGGYYIRTVEIDRKLVTRLKPRAVLAKKIADTSIAKERRSKEDNLMRAAAEELGVDYDSEEFEAEGSKGRRGRGSGRKKKERDAAGLTKGEVGALKAELKGLLNQRVNVGVSEKYLTSGRVDVDELLRQQEAGAGQEFLGDVQRGLLD